MICGRCLVAGGKEQHLVRGSDRTKSVLRDDSNEGRRLPQRSASGTKRFATPQLCGQLNCQACKVGGARRLIMK
jgi:hypothetical protein